jgi:hypothetical protein
LTSSRLEHRVYARAVRKTKEDTVDQPVACTLTPDAYRARTQDLAALAARGLRSREKTTDGARLLFADSAQMEADLRTAIAAEARCCPFLRMTLGRTDAGLVLEVSGPPEAGPVIAQLLAAP